MKRTIKLEGEEYYLLLSALYWDAERLKDLAQDASNIDLRRDRITLAERTLALRQKIIETNKVID